MAYLRAHPEHLPTFLTHQRIRETPVSGTARRLTLDDGTSLFAKTWPSGPAPAGFYAAEAAGLCWLRATGTVPLPEPLMDSPSMIAMEWIEPGSPSVRAAEEFGRELAALHDTPAPAFGAAWPGFIGPLTMDNTETSGPWGTWFGERRLRPYLRLSLDRGSLSAAEGTLIEGIIEELSRYDDGSSPGRNHGDLWPGNVLWATDGRAWLVDPAAHGGHRETDLASLALFGGLPHLNRVLATYQEVKPLAPGWKDRVPVHQLFLLLVHTAAFGAAYQGAVHAAATAAVRAF